MLVPQDPGEPVGLRREDPDDGLVEQVTVQRAGQRPEPADDGQQGVGGDEQVERVLRGDRAAVACEVRTGDGGEEAADTERAQLVPEGVEADGLGTLLVLPDGDRTASG